MRILFYEKIVVGNYENDRMQRYMEIEKNAWDSIAYKNTLSSVC